jgi:hypothetical protein
MTNWLTVGVGVGVGAFVSHGSQGDERGHRQSENQAQEGFVDDEIVARNTVTESDQKNRDSYRSAE